MGVRLERPWGTCERHDVGALARRLRDPKPDPVWMRNGDVCKIDIEGVGTLRNPIADEPA